MVKGALVAITFVASLCATLLSVPADQNAHAGAFPGVNGKIAFTPGSGSTIRDIYLVDPDGTNLTQITFDTASVFELHPRWSPDGTKIAFHRLSGTTDAIYVMGSNGNNPVLIASTLHGGFAGLTWSPDGTRIAFSDTREGEGGIYVTDTDGQNKVRLTTGQSHVHPAWSPDGTKIAYARPADIYVMNADGSDQVNVTNDGSGLHGENTDSYPSWSPNGDRIAFAKGDNPLLGSSVYVMNADGSASTKIADSGGYPVWSPDGANIAFTRGVELLVMDPDGSNQTSILNAGVSGLHLDWQSLPDTDDDGIADENDNCPGTANVGQENSDGDSLGDACDTCPYDSGSATNSGCPFPPSVGGSVSLTVTETRSAVPTRLTAAGALVAVVVSGAGLLQLRRRRR